MPEIELVAARPEHLAAVEAGPEALSRVLGGAEVIDGWSVFPEALRDLLGRIESPAGDDWGTHFYILADPRTLVGWGGFKGPPRDGTAELGYEVAPAVEGRGLATAIVAAMVAKARAGGARSLIAHTLPERNASGRVLEKNGFVLEDERASESGRRVWRWRLYPEAG